MRVGLFLDLRNPAGWRRPWDEHYARTMERIVEADRLGIDSIWLTEHHFFDDGYLPQPLTFAAAVAAATGRVRIGTAVLLAALRQPLHVAEQAAVVDLLSGGRFELGVGAGWSEREYEAFGADLSRRYRLTEEALGRVRELLETGAVMPPPLQKPLPLWLGYQGPKGARRAGRLGVGLLSMDGALLEPYRAGLQEGGHDPQEARMAGLADIIVADDPEEAYARVLPHYAEQVNSYRRVRSPDAPDLSVADVDKPGGIKVLTADDAVAALREQTAGLPVHDVRLWMSISGMPDDLVDRHIELLATRVRPALQDEEG